MGLRNDFSTQCTPCHPSMLLKIANAALDAERRGALNFLRELVDRDQGAAIVHADLVADLVFFAEENDYRIGTPRPSYGVFVAPAR